MSDCLKCWDTPCNCGYDYRDYNVEYFSKFIVDILSYKTPEERMQILQKAATGKGAARKEQVTFMTRALFGLLHNPKPDEADALAVGLTHLRRTAFSARTVPAVS